MLIASDLQESNCNQHQNMSQQLGPRRPGVITRTKQDKINSGEFFRMNQTFAKEPNSAPPPPQYDTSSRISPTATANRNHRQRGLLSACCFSFANLTLIFATVIALIVLVRFLQDEPLADYYEYLFSLRFYWQLVFVVCLMPLVLLVPIYNALLRLFSSSAMPSTSGLKSWSSSTTTSSSSSSSSSSHQNTQALLLKFQVFYQALMLLLALLALIFIVPFVQSSALYSQLDLKLKRFMRNRFESEFALRLMDEVQQSYQCCDQMWYRANLKDNLPLSCFVPQTNFSIFFDRTCSETLSSLIGFRCYLVAACLLVIIAALACLCCLDVRNLWSISNGSGRRRSYQVDKMAADKQANGKLGGTAATAIAAALVSDEFHRNQTPSLSSDEGLVDSRPNQSSSKRNDYRLQDERESSTQQPLLHKQQQQQQASSFRLLGSRESDLDSQPHQPGGVAKCRDDEPVLLARANYSLVRREHSQSPQFLVSNSVAGQDSTGPAAELAKPIKSALKKAASNSSSTNLDELDGSQSKQWQTIPSAQNGNVDAPSPNVGIHHESFDDGYEEEDNDYTERLRQSDSLLRQKQLQRDQQFRRSLLSVRFADDLND